MIKKVGRYEILDEIGQGGFAIVYRARDTVLDRLVALKELKPVLLGDTNWTKRFQREARLIARLDHPRIVTIYDVDEVDGRLFIVMRLVNGPTLAELIITRGRLPWPEAVEIITVVAEALDYAHTQGILHRDMKPANILLDPERGPLLSDFGMAKLVDDSSLSVTGSIVGTPYYIAPEVWEGQAATPQTDIYALGCILYELLTGEKVIRGETPAAVMSAHLKPLELPETWPQGVPAGVADVLSNALARKPADRYTTAGEMAQELAKLVTDDAVSDLQEKADDLLEIFTLGGLQLRRGGEQVEGIGSRRVEALLVYLARTGRPQPREVLADLLWDDRPQRQAMSNLRTVLTGLRQHFGPFVSISRDTVELNPDANIWLDVAELTATLAPLQEYGGLDSAEMVTQVEQAIGLYHGDFLEGFHLRGALGFEDWLTIERENLRQLVLDTLVALVSYHLAQGSYKAGITYARQLLQLDPLQEEVHRQLMRLLTYDGQRTAALAQYETCRQLMAEEFGIEPAAETTALYTRILKGELGKGAGKQRSKGDPDAVLPSPPAFLSSAPPHPSPPALFVAREQELAQLDRYLAEALNGQGKVVFITGEAGRGKTALLAEFAQRAQINHAELIVASGNCNAYSGLGDPYLPFRDVLGMLSGDVESKWAAGAITSEHARRLWSLWPHTVQTLLDEGPNLLDVFVSGSRLAKRVAENFPGQTGWSEQLKALSERAKAGAGNLEQRQLFEQYTQVLHTLSARQPLLVLLDDLQWADSASINLLFHLVRRSQDSRLLIVGAYRSSEVAAESAGAAPGRRHPLEPVLNEFKRLFGEIELDLGKIPATEGRAFVDALLDSEPNRLGEAFRAALFRQAKGHALFTVELLRDMQERGDLVQGEAGRWIEGPTLDWQALPARVEAIIEQRLGRLDEELQEILTIASVEGEVFTAQIVAQIQELDERQLLRRLSRELVRRHRLVTDQGEVQVGKNRLARFQFRHVLFQQYLYDRLSPGERRLLHGEMATLLEELYASHTDEITVQLARHYTEAGQGEKAIPHLLHAGDQARLAYAHEAAIKHYRQALTFLKEQGDDERAAATLMKLGLTYHNAFQFEQSRLAYDEAFALRQETRAVDSAALTQVFPTLRIALPEDLGVLDPAMITDVATAGIIEQLFSGLVRLSPEIETKPEVARSWQVLEGGRKYIFHLRNDVVWSDGVPVTAEDFEYAWKRVLNPTTGSPIASYLYVIKGATAFHQGQTSDPNTVGVQAVDPFTLLVELEEPTSYLLYMLGHYATFPVPRHIVAQFGPSWVAADRIVTNGPFRLEAYQPDGSMSLVRSPSYPGRRTGNVGRVEISLIKEHAARLKMYEADSLEMLDIAPFSPTEMGAIRRRYAHDYRSPPILDTFYVEFDLSRSPFADPRVRQAFVMAIDRQRWAIEVKQGFVSPALGGYIPPGMPGHSPQIGLPYDPEQARRLLTEAGFPGGRGFPAVDLLGVAVAQGEMQCQHLQTQWRENLGVEVSWKTLEFTTLLDRLSKALPNLHIMCWIADYPDPDNYLRVAALQHKKTWWNETYSQLVETARRTTDQQGRLKLYEQADKLLVEEAFIMPLYYNRSHLLVKPWVSTYPTSALGYWFWKDVVIDPSRQSIPPLPPTPHTLRTTAEGEPDTLDPTLCTDSTSGIIIDQLFRGLATETPDMAFVPDVVQRWEILEDGRKYIFHLRSDVTWSDSAPVTAADFEYAWKRVLNPATGSVEAHLLYDVKGAGTFHQGQVSNPDSVGVSALDQHTLVVELERPASYFLNLLASPITFPVPQHVVEMYGETWTDVKHIVTNGPFTLEAWRKGEVLSLRRNRTYHGQFGGNVERVEVFFSGDDLATELAWYEAGRLDVTRLPPLKGEGKQQRSGEYITHPTLRTYALGFNKSRPPFIDPRVRRALILAIDRPGLRDTFTEIYGVPATGGLCPPGMPGHSVDIGLPYDPVQARQLLTEAGYPEGRNFPEIDWLTVEFLEPLGGYLQKQWQTNLGIHLFNKQSTSWGTFQARAKQEQPALVLWGWVADYPDPDNFLRVCLQHSLPGWRNETFDQLVEQAGRMTDQRQRIELYQQADKILIEEAVLMPLTYGRYPLLVKPWVKQFVYAPHRRVFWQNVVIEPSLQPAQPKPASIPSPTSLTLRMDWPSPRTLDPTLVGDFATGTVILQLFSGLVEQTPEMEVVPDLARKWEILAAGQKYLFHLRDDVRWSDGVPVTAGDFEYAWKRLLAPRPTPESTAASILYDIKGARAYHQGDTSDPDQVGVRALNDLTLMVELEEPTGYFLQLLGCCETFPVPRHVVEAHREAWTAVDNIVTNGPFKLAAWQQPENSLILIRNPVYHGQFRGNVQQLELLSNVSKSTSLAQYEASELDHVSLGFSPQELVQARQRYPEDYLTWQISNTVHVGLDTSRPPFQDRRVRRALAMSIDKETLADRVLHSMATPARGGFVPPGMPGHSAGIGLPYDPMQAQRLLAEAGYPGGKEFPAVEFLSYPRYSPVGEYLQTQWQENLGIKINWQVMELEALYKRLREEPAPIVMLGWLPDYPDPDNFLRVCLSSEQLRWQNETYDRLLGEARRVTDHEVRMKLYQQADKILVEEAAVLPICYWKMHWLMKPRIRQFPIAPNRWLYAKDVTVEPLQQPVRPQPAVSPPPASRTLKVALGNWVSLDPTKAGETISTEIVHQLFSGLVETGPQMEVVPDVARSWEVLEGGRKYVFHLRDDVFWSDGTPVTAADFAFAWKRAIDPASASSSASLLYDLKGARAFHEGRLADPDQVGVRALDELTLEVELEAPAGYFLHLLTYAITYPVPQHVVAAHGEAWTEVEHMVTNGPFRLAGWEQGRLILLRNLSYHGHYTGNLERLELLPGDDLPGRVAMYESGDVDAASFYSPPPELDAVRQKYPAEYVSRRYPTTVYLGFDVSRPPFDDRRVRRAFALATDRETLATVVMKGYSFPATGGFIPPELPGHSADIALPYDPALARQLLAEAGYPEGRGFPVVEWLIPRFHEPMAAYLQSQWRQNLGVEISWQALEMSAIIDRQKKKQPAHMYFMGWTADYADPDNFLRVCLGWDWTRWRNDTYDRLVEEAGRLTDHEARLKLYRQADRILVEEVAILPLTYTRLSWLVKPWVKKFPLSPVRRWFPKDIVIEPSQQPVRPAILPSVSRTLKMTLGESLSTLDPALTIDSEIIGQLFSGLVESTPELDVVPDVARRWEILDGGRKYIFYLREDIRWSDGAPVTAHDFEYAWKRILDPATGSPAASLLYDIKEARAFHRGEVQPEAVGVRALDAVTLVIELEGPTGYFLNLLTYSVTYPVPRHTVEIYGKDWTAVDKIATNGPFRLESWQRGERLVLTRNEMYHGQFQGNVEKVEYLFLGGDIWSMSDWDTRALALYETGDLDVMRIAEAVGRARQKYAQEHISFPMFWTIYVSFDLSQPPFNDLRVRRAFALAVDSARYQNEVTRGLFAPATGGFLPPAMPGYSAGIGLPHDPVQARRLLAEAGYPDGYHFPKVKALGGTKQEAEYVQAQWRENLGVEVEWDVMDIVTAYEMASREVPALFFVAWGANYPDPDSFLRVCFQQPYHNWRHEGYNRLVEEARQLTDQKQRLKLYRQADRILMEQIPLAPLFYGRLHFLVKPWVRNFRLAPTWEAFWKEIIIEPH